MLSPLCNDLFLEVSCSMCSPVSTHDLNLQRVIGYVIKARCNCLIVDNILDSSYSALNSTPSSPVGERFDNQSVSVVIESIKLLNKLVMMYQIASPLLKAF